MASTRSLVELFRAIGIRNFSQASALAASICENEEAKGHRVAARQLRGALRTNGVVTDATDSVGAPIVPFEQVDVLSTALVRLSCDVRLCDVVLVTSARTELETVVKEWKQRELLAQNGLVRRSKILLHGLPGCGKSLTARALATECGVPIYVIRFDAVIGAYLGQTALHLRQLFRFAERTPCVLLLDELDALGKQRGNALDVGELDRVVIALLQELEHSRPKGFIVGTSNLASHLDDALWRRFDLALAYKAPSKASLRAFAGRVANLKGVSVDTKLARRIATSRTFADVEQIINSKARSQILAKV